MPMEQERLIRCLIGLIVKSKKPHDASALAMVSLSKIIKKQNKCDRKDLLIQLGKI